jgi:hypothetical protein
MMCLLSANGKLPAVHKVTQRCSLLWLAQFKSGCAANSIAVV